jgi:cell division protein FtsB
MAAPVREGEGRPWAGPRLLTLLAILLGLSLSLDARLLFPLVRGLQVSSDIVRQSREYHRQVAANDALAAEVAFLRTRAGARWAVYRYLGLVKPGQQVGRVVEEEAAESGPLSHQERVQAWIRTTEEAGARLLREWGRILGCYAGLRAPDQPAARAQPQRP